MRCQIDMKVDIELSRTLWPMVWLLMLAISGCARVNVPQSSAPVLPPNWRNAAAIKGLQLPTANLRSWWTAFADPRLSILVEMAIKNNLGLAASRARIRAAAEWLGMHRQGFKPMLQAATRNAQPADTKDSYFQFGVDANWELGLFGRKKAVVRKARGEMNAEKAKALAARVALVAQVVSSYLQLQAARDQRRLWLSMVSLDQQRETLLQTRVAAGLAAPVDVARVQGKVADDRAHVTHLNTRVSRLEQAVAVALAQDEPNLAWFGEASLPSLHQAPQKLPPAGLLQLRPDVTQAQANVEQALGNLGIAHANRFPQVALGAGLMWSTNVSRQHNLDTDFQMAPIFGPEITIPLFDWGRRLAAEQARASQLRAALLDYRQTVLRAVADVEDAFAAFRDSQQVLAERSQTLSAQSDALLAQERLVKLGLASHLSMLEAKRQRLLAKVQLSLALLDHDQAFVNLYQAYGGPALSAAEGH